MVYTIRGHIKDLILLVSLFTFALFFFSTFIVGCVYGLPYSAVPEPGESEAAVPLCSEGPAVGPSSDCICSVQFAGTKATFLVHAVLYLWLAGTAGFLISNVFRMYKDGKAFCNPAIFSLEVSVFANITILLYFIWSFLWHNEKWIAASVILALATITGCVAVVLYSINLFTETEFLHHNVPYDLWIHRVVVQNGLGMLATWMLCLFLTNTAIAMVNGSLRDPTASAIMIILLTYLFAVWSPMEMLVWDKLFRYMISPYLVLVWMLAGTYLRLDGERRNCYDRTIRVYSLVLLIIVVVVFVGRMLFTFHRHFRKPLAKSL